MGDTGRHFSTSIPRLHILRSQAHTCYRKFDHCSHILVSRGVHMLWDTVGDTRKQIHRVRFYGSRKSRPRYEYQRTNSNQLTNGIVSGDGCRPCCIVGCIHQGDSWLRQLWSHTVLVLICQEKDGNEVIWRDVVVTLSCNCTKDDSLICSVSYSQLSQKMEKISW